MASQRLEARFRPARVLLFAAIGALCLWGGAEVLRVVPQMDETFWAALGIGLGLVAVGATSLWMVFGIGAGIAPGLVLDERGLHHRLLGFVPWSETEAVELSRHGSRRLLYVRPSTRQSVQRRGLARCWPPRPGGDLLFPIEGFDQPPEQVIAAARALRTTAIEALPPLQRPRSEQAGQVIAQLEALAEAGAPISDLERLLSERRDRIVAELVQEYDLRAAARERRTRWANWFLAALLGVGAGVGLWQTYARWQ